LRGERLSERRAFLASGGGGGISGGEGMLDVGFHT
jgi:hypothetical protein